MKGSGLGLAIARSLVEMHGGSLRIRSLVGRGTIVMLHLPGPAAAPSLVPSARDGLRTAPARQSARRAAEPTRVSVA